MIVWCDNIGLVALILLGWELRASYITVQCVQAFMILSPLPSLYSHSNSKNFYTTCPLSLLITIPDAADHISATSIQQCYKQQKKDYVVYTPVAKHAVSYMNEKCTYGSLLTNTVYTKLSHVCCSASTLTTPSQCSVTSR